MRCTMNSDESNDDFARRMRRLREGDLVAKRAARKPGKLAAWPRCCECGRKFKLSPLKGSDSAFVCRRCRTQPGPSNMSRREMGREMARLGMRP